MNIRLIAVICNCFLVVFSADLSSVERDLFRRLEANEKLVQQLLGRVLQLEDQLSSEQRRTSALEETVRQLLGVISKRDVAAATEDILDETGSTDVSESSVKGKILHTGMPMSVIFTISRFH
jgi:hypothetical protein